MTTRPTFIIDKHYKKAETFLQAVSYEGELYNALGKSFIFRGQATDEFTLLPSALRDLLSLQNIDLTKETDKKKKLATFAFAETEIAQITKELEYLQEFFNLCDANGLYVPEVRTLRQSFYPGIDAETLFLKGSWLPQSYYELAALAQHHGVPTRLLDWSYDMNVAIYFAASSYFNLPAPRFDYIEYYKAKKEGKIYPPMHDLEIWALDTDVLMVQPATFPLKIIRPRYYQNDNLKVQKGLFTFWESSKPSLACLENDMKRALSIKTDRRPFDERLVDELTKAGATAKPYLYHITVPQSAAAEVYDYVDKLHYNASTMFPGYDGVWRYMKERHQVKSKRIVC